MAGVQILDDNNVERLAGTANFPGSLVAATDGAPTGAPADGVPFRIDPTGDLYFYDGTDWVLVAND